jgi:hypothetical protein
MRTQNLSGRSSGLVKFRCGAQLVVGVVIFAIDAAAVVAILKDRPGLASYSVRRDLGQVEREQVQVGKTFAFPPESSYEVRELLVQPVIAESVAARTSTIVQARPSAFRISDRAAGTARMRDGFGFARTGHRRADPHLMGRFDLGVNVTTW